MNIITYSSFDSFPFQVNFLCVILVVIIGIMLSLTFLTNKGNQNCTGFLKSLYDLLNFNKFIIRNLLKFSYIIIFLYITVKGLLLLFVCPKYALSLLIFGNLIVRLAFELCMAIVVIMENTNKICNSNESIELKNENDLKDINQIDDEEKL